MSTHADQFLNSALPDLIFSAAVGYIRAEQLEAASAALSHYLNTAPAEHAQRATAQELADGLASGRIAQEQADGREMRKALAVALELKAEQKKASQERRRIRKEKARHVPALLRDKKTLTQSEMRRRLDVGDSRQWVKILRRAMSDLGYDVGGQPNNVVVAAMRDYQDRQRRKQTNIEEPAA